MNESRAIDVIGLLGLAAVAWGCWQIYTPLGTIVPGAVMLGLAIYAGGHR